MVEIVVVYLIQGFFMLPYEFTNDGVNAVEEAGWRWETILIRAQNLLGNVGNNPRGVLCSLKQMLM